MDRFVESEGTTPLLLEPLLDALIGCGEDTYEEFAGALGLSAEDLLALLNGNLSLSMDLAVRLTQVSRRLAPHPA